MITFDQAIDLMRGVAKFLLGTGPVVGPALVLVLTNHHQRKLAKQQSSAEKEAREAEALRVTARDAAAHSLEVNQERLAAVSKLCVALRRVRRRFREEEMRWQQSEESGQTYRYKRPLSNMLGQLREADDALDMAFNRLPSKMRMKADDILDEIRELWHNASLGQAYQRELSATDEDGWGPTPAEEDFIKKVPLRLDSLIDELSNVLVDASKGDLEPDE